VLVATFVLVIASTGLYAPVGGFWEWNVASSPGFVFRIRVTCVRQLFGGLVLVGGVIVQATNPATIGHTSEIGVVDRRDVAAPE